MPRRNPPTTAPTMLSNPPRIAAAKAGMATRPMVGEAGQGEGGAAQDRREGPELRPPDEAGGIPQDHPHRDGGDDHAEDRSLQNGPRRRELHQEADARRAEEGEGEGPWVGELEDDVEGDGPVSP